MPGRYEAVLTVDGKQYRQPLTVRLDPRIHATQADLEAQLNLANKISQWMQMSHNAYNEIASVRAGLVEREKNFSGNSQAKDATAALEKEFTEIQEGTDAVPGFGTVNRDLSRFMVMIESGDMRPAKSARDLAIQSCESLKNALAHWNRVNAEGLPTLNRLLEQSKLAPLPVTDVALTGFCPTLAPARALAKLSV